MDRAELLTCPHASLTRKQRKERAALKAQMARAVGIRPGYEIGRVEVAPGAYRVGDGLPLPALPRAEGTIVVFDDPTSRHAPPPIVRR